MAARKLAALLAAVLQLCSCHTQSEQLPEFLAALENHTVIQGRDVFFTCVVNHLQSYKVAWIKSDSRAILAIQTHMVANNPRISVTHNGHNTWKLHVSNVQKNDSGTYMCQINTDPMRSRMGHMVVVIPPDIIDDESSDGLVAHEGGSVRMRCRATGSPTPTVTWRREDFGNIILRESDGKKRILKNYEGETLELTSLQRQEMGSYLCIASNGIPPTVSKRYSVSVHFQPVIKVKNHMVAAPTKSDVTLECNVEASPHAMNTWYRDTGEKLLPSSKYAMTEDALGDYTWQMNLTVYDLEQKDFGGYVCSAENALGKAEGIVRLQELKLEKTTPETVARNTDHQPRKKPQKGSKKKVRRPYDDDFSDEGNSLLDNNSDLGTTQVMGGNTQEGHRTERPLAVPSFSPPWVILNAASSRRFLLSQMMILLLPLATTL